MTDEIDKQELARTIHNLLAGVGVLVAGAYAGPAGAQAVTTAAGSVDQLLKTYVPGKTPKSVDNKQTALFLPKHDPEWQQVARLLSSKGWTKEQIDLIGAGPQFADLELLKKPVSEGKRVDLAKGEVVRLHAGKVVPTSRAEPQGIRVGEPDPNRGKETG